MNPRIPNGRGVAPRLARITEPSKGPLPDPTARGDRLEHTGPYCELQFRPISTEVWTKRAPDAVVAAFLAPGSCLVVGDTPGDPDCFGSAIAWARARRSLGLPAEAHVAAPPPKALRPVLLGDDLVSSHHVAEQRYETVVLVDNDGTRIGPAATEALRHAKRVVIVDHHDVHPTKESLGLAPDVELIVWKDLGADAAGLMTMATILRGLDAAQAEWTVEGWRDVLGPLLAAIYSDTRGFEASRTRPVTMQLLRSIIESNELDLGAILRGFDDPLPQPIRERLLDQIQERSEDHGSDRLGLFVLSGSAMLEAWAAARASVPDLTWSDVLFTTLGRVEVRAIDAGYDVILFATSTTAEQRALLDPGLLDQLPAHSVKFSIRSVEPTLAAKLAVVLGGNGKHNEAGGNTEEPIDEILRRTSQWMKKRAELLAHTKAFRLGSL